jgi:GTPase SAR1 family protein
MNNMSAAPISPMDVWHSQKPTLALMGEFSAGKSTLLNLILGKDFLKTCVTATNLPAIWLTHAAEPAAQSLTFDGELRSLDMGQLDRPAGKDTLLIRLALPSDILRDIDIIDTPGISDSRQKSGALEFLTSYLDYVIWCSASNQAWRQSEKAMWLSLPERLRTNSTLALTRSDILRLDSDLEKVIRRCERETDGLFGTILPISATLALEAIHEGEGIPEQDKWLASNAPALFENINAAVEWGALACAEREIIPFPEMGFEVLDAVETLEPSEKATELPAVENREAQSQASDNEAISDNSDVTPEDTNKDMPAETEYHTDMLLSDLLDQLCRLRLTVSQDEYFFRDLGHIVTSFAAHNELSDGQKMVLNQVGYSGWEETMPKAKLIGQMVQELNDFGENTWCKLN